MLSALKEIYRNVAEHRQVPLPVEEAARIDTIELDGDPEWAAAGFVGGVKHLPVRYTMA